MAHHRSLALALALLLAPIAEPSPPGSSTLTGDEFLELARRATESWFPPGSREAKIIGENVRAINRSLASSLSEQHRQGLEQSFCPPKQQRWFSPQDLLAHVESLGPESRNAGLQDIVRTMLIEKYPCMPRNVDPR